MGEPARALRDAGVERIGRYQILGELASGGMASVFLALETGPGGYERVVAIKTILGEKSRAAAGA